MFATVARSLIAEDTKEVLGQCVTQQGILLTLLNYYTLY